LRSLVLEQSNNRSESGRDDGKNQCDKGQTEHELPRSAQEEPLEVSYIEQRTTPPSPRRYDVILASAHWNVGEVAYGYDASVVAGSDHAFVHARLTGRETSGRVP
jgi:hypothetical protein